MSRRLAINTERQRALYLLRDTRHLLTPEEIAAGIRLAPSTEKEINELYDRLL